MMTHTPQAQHLHAGPCGSNEAESSGGHYRSNQTLHGLYTLCFKHEINFPHPVFLHEGVQCSL